MILTRGNTHREGDQKGEGTFYHKKVGRMNDDLGTINVEGPRKEKSFGFWRVLGMSKT